MHSKNLRAAAVRHALTRRAAHPATELQLLTQYVLGQRTLAQTNEQLRGLGLAIQLKEPA